MDKKTAVCKFEKNRPLQTAKNRDIMDKKERKGQSKKLSANCA